MKKISTLLIFLAFLAGTASAQHFDIRAYGGFNVLQLSTDQGTSIIDGTLHQTSISGRPGYQFGAALTFGSRFFVQPGVQFATLSTESINESSLSNSEYTDQTTLSVLSIPLKVGFRLIDPETENIINVRIFGGIDGSHVMSVDHPTNSGKIGDITEDDYNNLIVSGDFGMGIDILFLYFDAGYSLGLTPVHSGADQAKANAFYTNIGLRLSF